MFTAVIGSRLGNIKSQFSLKYFSWSGSYGLSSFSNNHAGEITSEIDRYLSKLSIYVSAIFSTM